MNSLNSFTGASEGRFENIYIFTNINPRTALVKWNKRLISVQWLTYRCLSLHHFVKLLLALLNCLAEWINYWIDLCCLSIPSSYVLKSIPHYFNVYLHYKSPFLKICWTMYEIPVYNSLREVIPCFFIGIRRKMMSASGFELIIT